jgi:hypothetical protein
MSIKTKVQTAWESDPLMTAGIGATLLIAVSKLMNANTNRKNAKTWRKEVARRERKSGKKK